MRPKMVKALTTITTNSLFVFQTVCTNLLVVWLT